jgi:uncharacterized protein
MEYKSFAIEELKALDDEARTIEGYGSIFGNVDSYGDIVMPGAFAKSIKKRKPAMLWQHNSNQPIGVWDEIEETDKGLRLKGRIIDTSLGDDAYKLAKAGALTGLSIGYSTVNYETDNTKDIRKLLEVKLYEVSLVTFPANEKATITGVKAAHDTERDFEHFLRDAGYSREAAKIITARGYKALSGQREAESEELQLLAEALDRFAPSLNPTV